MFRVHRNAIAVICKMFFSPEKGVCLFVCLFVCLLNFAALVLLLLFLLVDLIFSFSLGQGVFRKGRNGNVLFGTLSNF